MYTGQRRQQSKERESEREKEKRRVREKDAASMHYKAGRAHKA